MFTISVETTFQAKHQITMPNGIKEPLHTHDWIVKTAVTAEKLDRMGLAVEFGSFKDTIEKVIAPLKNAQLEHLKCFLRTSTTAENVAKFIYDKLAKLLPSDVKLEYVEVTEEKGCSAKYWK